jgi:hypothetical protein
MWLGLGLVNLSVVWWGSGADAPVGGGFWCANTGSSAKTGGGDIEDLE